VPPFFWRLGDHVQGQRGLAAGFRAVDLHHAAARQAADAERGVEGQRTGGHRLDVVGGAAVAHAHDGALAELPLDLGSSGHNAKNNRRLNSS
jgi:hypothetical protein